jgi:hypothetical protein
LGLHTASWLEYPRGQGATTMKSRPGAFGMSVEYKAAAMQSAVKRMPATGPISRRISAP